MSEDKGYQQGVIKLEGLGDSEIAAKADLHQAARNKASELGWTQFDLVAEPRVENIGESDSPYFSVSAEILYQIPSQQTRDRTKESSLAEAVLPKPAGEV